jgi:DNA-binding MarR family transcriptional regulator
MCVVMSDSDESAESADSTRLKAAADPGVGAAVAVRADDWRLAAWRSFLRTHTRLLRRLEQQLLVHGKIALGTYDVLIQLAEAPENRLRMSELAEAVLLSRSGLTRLVDRLQKEGLVERRPDPEDARGMYTVLTAKGLDTLRDASQVHLAGVAELVLDRLSEPELRQLQALMIRLDPTPTRPAE